jgi:prolyl oligopeptidase
MISRLCALLLASLAIAGFCALGSDWPDAPATPKKPVTVEVHGVQVTDNYQWLENAGDSAVERWTEAQNRRTRKVLDSYVGLPAVRRRLQELIDTTPPSYDSLQYRGGKLFALKTQPPREQPFLITLKSADDPASEQVVFDPNKLNTAGTTAIDFFVPSLDGKLVAVCMSEGGSEDGTVHVFETATGSALPDVIRRVNLPTAGGSLAWSAGDGGFYYTRYPHEGERPRPELNSYQQVYFHKLGTQLTEDTYAVGKDLPSIAENMLESSRDGRYVLDMVQKGDGGEFEHFLRDPAGKWIQLTHFEDRITAATFGADEALYMLSLKDAPRGKLMRLPLNTPDLGHAKVVVPESDVAIDGFRLGAAGLAPTFVATTGRLYVLDSIGGPSRIRVFDHEGRQLEPVPILPVSAVGEMLSVGGDRVLFHNQSFIEQPAWYRFDPSSGKTTRTALYDPSAPLYHDTEVIRDFAVSKDGTKVPLNIIQRKGTKRDGRNPTLLTGYGGFGISLTPAYSAARRIWLDQGGIYVIANLRGGGEYGEPWHKAGNLTHKQHVFDDFLACARYLVDHGYTSPNKLAIMGGSNGGLLVGAALTQQPELFRAVVARVGIYDMLLHDHHPNGAFNVTEYGTVKDPEQAKAIMAYSPYHHVQDGTAYPAVLLMTGANDGRVDPGNSRKFAARLQAANSGGHPILLAVDSGSGHGIGTGLSKHIAQEADVYSFLFQQLGVTFRTQ